MSRKGATEDKARGTAPKGNRRRVIVTEAFDGHLWGAEIELPAGAKLDKLIADKKVRLDDRMAPPKAAEAETKASEAGDEG